MGSKLTYDTGTGLCLSYIRRGAATKNVAASAGVLLNPDVSGISKPLSYYHITGSLGPPDTRAIALRSDADRLVFGLCGAGRGRSDDRARLAENPTCHGHRQLPVFYARLRGSGQTDDDEEHRQSDGHPRRR